MQKVSSDSVTSPPVKYVALACKSILYKNIMHTLSFLQELFYNYIETEICEVLRIF